MHFTSELNQCLSKICNEVLDSEIIDQTIIGIESESVVIDSL
jgi:hypothetical protein